MKYALPMLLALAALRPALAEPLPAVRAQLVPVHATLISSEMAGRIAELPLREGERFEAGATLLRFACSEQESRLARAEATLTKKQRTLEVNARLNKMQSISKLELDISKAEVDEAAADVQLAQTLNKRCLIKAPFPGRVVERHAQRYQSVSEGAPLLDILDDSQFEIEAIVPSQWLQWLQPGHVFTLDVDETGKHYEARIARIGARVDPVSQSVKIYGQLQTPAPELLAGMSGQLQITP